MFPYAHKFFLVLILLKRQDRVMTHEILDVNLYIINFWEAQNDKVNYYSLKSIIALWKLLHFWKIVLKNKSSFRLHGDFSELLKEKEVTSNNGKRQQQEFFMFSLPFTCHEGMLIMNANNMYFNKLQAFTYAKIYHYRYSNGKKRTVCYMHWPDGGFPTSKADYM